MKGIKVSKDYTITVVGAGYVGMSLSVLLSLNNRVILHDIDKERLACVDKNVSPVGDDLIQSYLKERPLDLSTSCCKKISFDDSDFIVIATPTDYDIETNKFDTRSVDNLVESILHHNNSATIVIKSTIPVGHTRYLQNKYDTDRIVFSPEFLREGTALYDNLYPSRIIIGNESKNALDFANILKSQSLKKENHVVLTSSTEAEAIKLFSNTYLAMRISFFNELDTFASSKNLNSEQIINGVCLDQRIGNFYNNPSFGYGGYCLPKDTKQLLKNYENVPQSIINAIVESNSTRKDFIAHQISLKSSGLIGIYKLAMKKGSDNFRSSAIIGIIERLKEKGHNLVIYEPHIADDSLFGCKKISDLDQFKEMSSLIVANRYTKDLFDVRNKVFTRDIFGIN